MKIFDDSLPWRCMHTSDGFEIWDRNGYPVAKSVEAQAAPRIVEIMNRSDWAKWPAWINNTSQRKQEVSS